MSEWVHCEGCDEYCFDFLPTVKAAVEEVSPASEKSLRDWLNTREAERTETKPSKQLAEELQVFISSPSLRDGSILVCSREHYGIDVIVYGDEVEVHGDEEYFPPEELQMFIDVLTVAKALAEENRC